MSQVISNKVWDELRNILHETRTILDQQDNPALLEERTRQLARPIQQEQDAEHLAQVLLFTLGDERYGWSVANVKAIARIERITPVPFAPRYYRGVTSLRGQILSVLDLRSYLNLPPLSVPEEYIVVIDGAKLEIAVLASAAYDVLDIPLQSLIPASSAGLDSELITGIAPDGLTLLNVDALLRRERQRIDSKGFRR